MRSVYQPPKSPTYGVSLCEGCLEKQRGIDRLKEEIQQLRLKLSAKKRKEKEGFFGSSTPSARIPVKASAPAAEASKRGRAKPGHKGNGRKKQTEPEVDEVRTVEVESRCPYCHAVMKEKDDRERSVLDLNPLQVVKVLYRLQRRECGHGQRVVGAQAAGALPRLLLPNQLLAEVIDSHYLHGMPLERVCARWELNYGPVIQALHHVAGLFGPVLRELKAIYQQSWVRHADETGWRVDGQNGYCWLFTSDSVRRAPLPQDAFFQGCGRSFGKGATGRLFGGGPVPGLSPSRVSGAVLLCTSVARSAGSASRVCPGERGRSLCAGDD